MNCDHFITLINGHLDGANTFAEEESLQEHLKACEACRVLLSTMEKNDALLREQKAHPPADLSAKIMQQVRNNPKKRKKTAFYTSLAASGFAAAAMFGLIVSGNVKPPEKEIDPIVTVQNRSIEPDISDEATVDINEPEMAVVFYDDFEVEASEAVAEDVVVNVPKKHTRSAAVLILCATPSELEIDGEALDPQNLPSSVENAGYSPTGEELAAYSVSWSELQRVLNECCEDYDSTLYADPEATYKQGIIIFVN